MNNFTLQVFQSNRLSNISSSLSCKQTWLMHLKLHIKSSCFQTNFNTAQSGNYSIGQVKVWVCCENLGYFLGSFHQQNVWPSSNQVQSQAKLCVFSALGTDWSTSCESNLRQTFWHLVKGVGPHVGADGVLQRSVPFADHAVVFWLDQQLRALTSLQLQPGERQNKSIPTIIYVRQKHLWYLVFGS